MSKKIAYHCANCGRDFEAEEKEIVECPQCYWSSSVKPASEAGIKTPDHGTSAVKQPRLHESKKLNLKGIAVFFIIVTVIAAAGLLLPSVLKKIESSLKSKSPRTNLEIKVPKPVKAKEAALPDVAVPSKPDDTELAMLARRIDLNAPFVPSEKQQQTLSREVPFQTGVIERLPSQVWDYPLFEQTLADQMIRYKVTLPRSYQKKLKEHFEATYQAGADAFIEGKLLDARNAWVRTLAFPLYSQDIQKHRGVALTLLRPFTEDVLSKVGAVNTMLVDGNLRGEEQKIQAAYRELKDLIQKNDWQASDQKAESLIARLLAFESQNTTSVTAPPYPQEIVGIDQGIAVTLMDLLKPSQSSTADLTLLEQDVKMKREIIKQLLPENIKGQVSIYDQAMQFIAQENWPQATQLLQSISFPPLLKEDAAQKLKVLKRLQNQSLDSVSK